MNYLTPTELISLTYGPMADSDSYKLSHLPQYAPGATRMESYIESRGGEYDKVLWVGMNIVIKESLMKPLTNDQAKNMMRFARIHMMQNMCDDLAIALDRVVNQLDGKIPIVIRSAPEGLVIPVKNVLAVIASTIDDPYMFALVSYFETLLLRVWGPTTVATTSYHVRELIMDYLIKTSDDPAAEIAFKLHDFGSRGVACPQSAMFMGLGHLAVFQGTDNIMALHGASFAYNTDMAGYSIPASEHSTTTSRGRDGEVGLVEAMFDNFAVEGGLFATVADSYDVLNFIRDITPQFKDRLIDSGATWIIRPDSCDPIEMPVKCVIELDKVFGHTVNSKGYKVLNNVRVIQGDGIVPADIQKILDRLVELGYSASNMAFGMGGGLLQKVNRDTVKFSMKCSAICVDGEWQDVYKDPSEYDENWNRIGGGSFKKSKAGRLELMYHPQMDEYQTVRISEVTNLEKDGWVPMLVTIYKDGELLVDPTWDEVTQRVEESFA